MERIKETLNQNEQQTSDFEINESLNTDREIKKAVDERAAHQERVQNLRNAINLEQIASKSNPEGYQSAVKESLDTKIRIQKEQQRLDDIHAEQATTTHALALDEQSLASLHTSQQARADSLVYKLKTLFHIKDKKMQSIEKQESETAQRAQSAKETLQNLQNESQELSDAIQNINPDEPLHEFLEKYETPLNPDEKEKLLQFDSLAELSTDEYLKLWRRLNPFFVTHITRQGIRDHNGIGEHAAGLGQFHNGFTDILKANKSLLSPAKVRHGIGISDNAEVARAALDEGEKAFLENKSIDSMREDLRKRENLNSAPKTDQEIDGEIFKSLMRNLPIYGIEKNISGLGGAWSDISAIHFGQNTVLNEIYGGEDQNEIFVVYPADVIASQCRFGSLKDNIAMKGFTSPNVSEERKWNDLFVWTDDGTIPIDAGLVFIPKSTQVDRETGSRYQESGDISNLKHSENTVEASTFWENYFDNHPDLRPSHVIYYDGDPNEALKTLLEQHEIIGPSTPMSISNYNKSFTGRSDSSERDGRLLGFDKHYVEKPEDDPMLQKSHQEFIETVKQMAAERYGLSL